MTVHASFVGGCSRACFVECAAQSWTAPLHQIASIDNATNTVALTTVFDAQWAGGASGARYYAENFLEALDSPGEFYYDRFVGLK